jgi:TrmH family RNA methyltransferase
MNWKTIAAEIERTATARGRATSGHFSVEGFRLVERALASGYEILSVLIGESSVRKTDLRARRLIDELEKRNVPIAYAPDLGLGQIIEGRETGAIAALLTIPKAKTLAKIVPPRGSARLLVAVHVDDPGNVGALARTALAGGADGLVLVGPGDPYHPRAVRISRGSVFKLPIVRLDTPELLLEQLAELEVESIAAVTQGGIPLPSLRPQPRTRWAICVGSEAFGLSDALIAKMDREVSIPMTGEIDSYSVHAAAAIMLYALRPPVED